MSSRRVSTSWIDFSVEFSSESMRAENVQRFLVALNCILLRLVRHVLRFQAVDANLAEASVVEGEDEGHRHQVESEKDRSSYLDAIDRRRLQGEIWNLRRNGTFHAT